MKKLTAPPPASEDKKPVLLNRSFSGLTVQHLRYQWGESSVYSDAPDMLSITLARPTKLRLAHGSDVYNGRFAPHDLAICPKAEVSEADFEDRAEFALFHFEPDIFTRVSADINSSGIELEPKFIFRDSLILQLGCALLTEARVEPEAGGNPLYLESLANTLVLHLLAKYSKSKLPQPNLKGGMPRAKLKRTIDFINSNLERDITLNDIAAEADLSAYHFSRLFKQSTGVPPHRYLLQARIEKAKSLLKNPQDSIAEIAHKLGFSDQSHFTMFFKRFTGFTPKSFREKL